MTRPKLWTYEGKTLTARQWADKLGVEPTTMIKRLGKWGPTPWTMVGPGVHIGRDPRTYPVYGENMTAKQVSEIFKVHSSTVSRWAEAGKNVEDEIEKIKDENAKKLDAD